MHILKSRVQKYERKILAQFYERKTRNSIIWKFLGNYMLGNSWKLYAGKFLETICGKIRMDAECFLKGVIMAPCYGTILQWQRRPFQNEAHRSERSYSKCRAEDGDAKSMMAPMGAVLHGQAWQRQSESEGFSLMMTRLSVVQGNPTCAPVPRDLAKITLVWYLSMVLHKGDLQLV